MAGFFVQYETFSAFLSMLRLSVLKSNHLNNEMMQCQFENQAGSPDVPRVPTPGNNVSAIQILQLTIPHVLGLCTV